jgi:hypothetical protein
MNAKNKFSSQLSFSEDEEEEGGEDETGDDQDSEAKEPSEEASDYEQHQRRKSSRASANVKRLFEQDGIPHGLRWRSKGEPLLKPGLSPSKSPFTLGHNGFKVGQWWAYRSLAWLSGMHGNDENGIDVDTNADPPRAYAVAQSGGGENNDEARYNKDEGETIRYSGPDAWRKRYNGPSKDALTVALRNTASAGKGKNIVRVIRGQKGFKKGDTWCPRAGFRYDGLYFVDHRMSTEDEDKNKERCDYDIFTLTRLPVKEDAGDNDMSNPYELKDLLEEGGPLQSPTPKQLADWDLWKASKGDS